MQCFPLASQIPEVIPGPVSSRLRQMQHIKGTKLMGHDQYHPNSTFSFLNLSNLSSRKCRQFPQASGSRICFPCAHLLRQWSRIIRRTENHRWHGSTASKFSPNARELCSFTPTPTYLSLTPTHTLETKNTEPVWTLSAFFSLWTK